MKVKVFSILALLLMAATGAWAQQDQPLTLEAMTDGVQVSVSGYGTVPSSMQYDKNGLGKVQVTKGEQYSLNQGETIKFYGSAASYSNVTISCTGGCYVYGNVMSLVDENDFATATILTEYRAFSQLFYNNRYLYSHPTKKLVLPARNLEINCYYSMFYNCRSLNTVTCLATDISAYGATNYWLNGVDSEGTFYKANGMTGWSTGANGIPDGWTTLDYTVTLTDGDNPSAALSAYTGKTCEVEYTRSFTENKPATVCLPFAYTPNQWSDDKFYTFSGIKMEGSDYVADMTEVTSATLEANTPYLFVASSTGDVYFNGTYAIPSSITAGETARTDCNWTFVGTYSGEQWTTAPTGIYGFSAQNVDGQSISQGEFVKVGAYVRVKPMRCYLKYKSGTVDYAEARARAPRNTAEEETLPERISVRLIGADGVVTGIGSLHTATGEVTLDDAAWYSLDGTRFSSKPTRKGIYVNNGKKVIIK